MVFSTPLRNTGDRRQLSRLWPKHKGSIDLPQKSSGGNHDERKSLQGCHLQRGWRSSFELLHQLLNHPAHQQNGPHGEESFQKSLFLFLWRYRAVLFAQNGCHGLQFYKTERKLYGTKMMVTRDLLSYFKKLR